MKAATKENENLTPKDPAFSQKGDATEQATRPPVVVVLGHIDHGKTTLLDFIKKTKVTEKESGGITQHIGAYQVQKDDKLITFIDTPGHEAFSQIRSRGAKLADIAVLVVDATEGVKPQTKEAISHVKEAEVPQIVAINKMDKPGADPERVKRELAKEGILVESLGGKIPAVEISAKTGQGVPELLELILIVAEMENLKTDISKPVEGTVIESYLDGLRGPVATLILNQGVLRPGQVIGTDSTFGKIKKLEDAQGNVLSQVLPSQPAIALGFEDAPRVGEKLKVFSIIEEAQSGIKSKEERVFKAVDVQKGQKALNLILKADVLGSLEAIEEILDKLPQEKVVLRILKARVGEINESDLKIALQAKAKILGFRVKTNLAAKAMAEREKIKIMNFDVIYDLVEGVRKYMDKFLEPEIVRTDFGKMKTLVIFLTEKNRQIVGGKIIEGQVQKGVSIEVMRREEIVGRGRLINLQKDKKDIGKAAKGEECGILYEGDVKIEQGDILLFFTQERKKAGV